MIRMHNYLNTTSPLTAREVCQALTDVALGETHHDAKLDSIMG
jgi:dihydrodipicolinate reductase